MPKKNSNQRDFNRDLLEAVKHYPALFEYSPRRRREWNDGWREVARLLKTTSKRAMEGFRKLKKSFKDAANVTEFEYFPEMQFIAHLLRPAEFPARRCYMTPEFVLSEPSSSGSSINQEVDVVDLENEGIQEDAEVSSVAEVVITRVDPLDAAAEDMPELDELFGIPKLTDRLKAPLDAEIDANDISVSMPMDQPGMYVTQRKTLVDSLLNLSLVQTASPSKSIQPCSPLQMILPSISFGETLTNEHANSLLTSTPIVSKSVRVAEGLPKSPLGISKILEAVCVEEMLLQCCQPNYLQDVATASAPVNDANFLDATKPVDQHEIDTVLSHMSAVSSQSKLPSCVTAVHIESKLAESAVTCLESDYSGIKRTENPLFDGVEVIATDEKPLPSIIGQIESHAPVAADPAKTKYYEFLIECAKEKQKLDEMVVAEQLKSIVKNNEREERLASKQLETEQAKLEANVAIKVLTDMRIANEKLRHEKLKRSSSHMSF
uniref:MADF domain-containing protein n=1 Tax=Ditylenchus dipsaci TaxID=166011 RepID=A0A915EBY6_9BILA